MWALLTCIILSGHTALRPNKGLAGERTSCHPHDIKLLVTIVVPISWCGQPAHGHIADLCPRCLADLERFFAKHAKHAGMFQHPRREFHSHTSRGEPAGLAAVTF